MKSILLPTDFSENSKNAIDYALTFFKGQTCDFVFLNVQKVSNFVMDDFYTAPNNVSIDEAIMGDNRENIKKFVAQYENKYPEEKFNFSSLVDFDVFSDSINQAVKAKNIDLIIMGSNGATGAKEVLFGSNTLNVIRKVDCPVLIIPENYKFKKVDSILFSLHNNQSITKTNILLINNMLEYNQATLKVLEVIDEKKEKNLQNSQTTSENLFPKDTEYFRLQGIPLPMAISAFTQLFNVEIHAMFAKKESFLNRFIFGSATKRLDYGTTIPLLVLRE